MPGVKHVLTQQLVRCSIWVKSTVDANKPIFLKSTSTTNSMNWTHYHFQTPFEMAAAIVDGKDGVRHGKRSPSSGKRNFRHSQHSAPTHPISRPDLRWLRQRPRKQRWKPSVSIREIKKPCGSAFKVLQGTQSLWPFCQVPDQSCSILEVLIGVWSLLKGRQKEFPKCVFIICYFMRLTCSARH